MKYINNKIRTTITKIRRYIEDILKQKFDKFDLFKKVN